MRNLELGAHSNVSFCVSASRVCWFPVIHGPHPVDCIDNKGAEHLHNDLTFVYVGSISDLSRVMQPRFSSQLLVIGSTPILRPKPSKTRTPNKTIKARTEFMIYYGDSCHMLRGALRQTIVFDVSLSRHRSLHPSSWPATDMRYSGTCRRKSARCMTRLLDDTFKYSFKV